MKKAVQLSAFILISLAAGIIGAIYTTPAIDTWYAELNKPFFNPPNWLFGPVWTLLYFLMGISAYLVWEADVDRSKKTRALTIFGVQLILNTLWSIIFFGLKNPGIAFLEILLLWTAITATILKFYKINKTAGYLLIPYLLWVTFAGMLNLAIIFLN